MPMHKHPLENHTDGAVIKSGSEDRMMPLVSTDISVEDIGGLMVVSTKRVFRNPSEKSIEATITFPVPVHATLSSLKVSIDGRNLNATAQAKKQARANYEQAIDDGKTAVLHEEALRGIHVLNVGHIPAGKDVEVTSTYVMAPTIIGGEVSLTIPTTVGDIYGKSPLSDADDLVTSDYLHIATLSVKSDSTITADTASEKGDALTSEVNEPMKVALNRSIRLTFDGWKSVPLVGEAKGRKKVVLKIDLAPVSHDPADIEIVADISGSMQENVDPSKGTSFRSAGEDTKYARMIDGLSKAAESMCDWAVVRLWAFNNRSYKVGEVTAHSFKDLLAKIPAPHGGTEIGMALMKTSEDPEYGDVLLITDGRSNNIDVQALSNTGKRYSVVLIGKASLEARVGYLAALTGGEIFVAGEHNVGDAIIAAMNTLRHPRQVETEVSPDLNKVVESRSGLLLTAEWNKRAPKGAVRSAEVDAFCAAMAIPHLEEEAATALAVEAGIVCHLTSLILVDEAGEVSEGLPTQHKVALTEPGYRGMMSFASSAPALRSMSLSAESKGMGMVPAGFVSDAFSNGFQENTSRYRFPDPIGETNGGKDGQTDAAAVAWDEINRRAISTPPLSIQTLSNIVDAIDWSKGPDKLLKGDLSGLPFHVAETIRKAVVAYSASLNLKLSGNDMKTPSEEDKIVYMLGLLASAKKGDRYAARFAKKVLSGHDKGDIERTVKAYQIAA